LGGQFHAHSAHLRPTLLSFNHTRIIRQLHAATSASLVLSLKALAS